MANDMQNRIKPRITLNDIDHARLVQLAESAQARIPEMADELLAELDRADVVPASSIGASVVQIGSKVTYDANGVQREVILVYPGEADISAGKISILTPIGTALIGLSPGQRMSWKARDGSEHVLTVVDVQPPAP